MITVITGAAIAFFQSTRIERFVTRNYAELARARLAAEGATAAAQARIAQGVGSSFQYISGQDENASFTYLWTFTLDANSQPVLQPSGPVRLASTNTNAGDVSTTIVIDAAAGLRRTVPAVEITNGTDTNRSIRYAFWVDDNTSCFNPVRSGANNRPPGLGPGSLALPYRTGSGNSFGVIPGNSLAAWQSNLSFSYGTNVGVGQTYAWPRWPLLTPRTMNLITNPAPGTPFQDYDLAADSFADVASPAGTPKVNLRVLAAYANTLAQNQSSGNAKAQLVENLLTNTNATWQSGVTVTNSAGAAILTGLGGNFRFLLNRYSPAEARQIVANLVDYLDADRIPTTDNADNPTYFGMESWPAGTPPNTYAAGHPFISYVCAGLVFNWSGAAGRQGGLNSTRVLAGVGLVNPWPEPVTFNWGTRYRWVLNFAVTGNVTPVPAGFTSNAQSFFMTNLTERLTEGPTTLATGGQLAPFPISKNTNFANFNNIAGSAIKELLTFRNLGVQPSRVRLEFSTNSGTSWFTIANLEACLSNQPTSMPDVTSPGNSGSTVLMFNRPGNSSIRDWHLRSDPRIGFSTNSWRLTVSTVQNDIPTPTDNVSAVSARNSFSDPPQGLPSDVTWFRNAAMTNHFNGHFSKTSTNQSANSMTYSIGELGFLSTGQPWKTLNLVETDPPAAGQEDWRILDYVTSGEMPEEPVNSSFLTNTLSTPRGRVIRGPINANSRKFGTWLGWLTGSTPNAGNAASEIAALGTNSLSACVGSVFTNGWVNQFGDTNNQLLRENAVRAVADGLTVSSRTFTVYAVGESLLAGRVVGRASLRTLILVDTDPTTGQPRTSKLQQSFQ